MPINLSSALDTEASSSTKDCIDIPTNSFTPPIELSPFDVIEGPSAQDRIDIAHTTLRSCDLDLQVLKDWNENLSDLTLNFETKMSVLSQQIAYFSHLIEKHHNSRTQSLSATSSNINPPTSDVQHESPGVEFPCIAVTDCHGFPVF
jgi:hypothetical protein